MVLIYASKYAQDHIYSVRLTEHIQKNACEVVVLAADKEYANQSMLTKFLVILWLLLLQLELRELFVK